MKSVLTFIAGLAIGAGVTYVIQKNRYEEMVKEEIDDLRDHMKEKTKEERETVKEKVKKMNGEDSTEECDFNAERLKREEEYDELLKKHSYTTNDDSETEKFNPPYVVTPQEFANRSGYDVISYNYYDDDIIANDDDEELDEENISWTLGMSTEEVQAQFGIYEDDSVYVRNEQLKTDFEILRQNENYTRRNGY